MARSGWNVVVSNHRGLGGITITVSSYLIYMVEYVNLLSNICCQEILLCTLPLYAKICVLIAFCSFHLMIKNETK